jgi:hypothetical protein
VKSSDRKETTIRFERRSSDRKETTIRFERGSSHLNRRSPFTSDVPSLRSTGPSDTNLSAISMRPSRFRSRIPLRAILARVACALVAVAILFGIGQARARYFYCEVRGLSATDPCIHELREHPRCPLAVLDRVPVSCCEVITMPPLPQGERGVEPSVASAGVVAVLPAASSSGERSPNSGGWATWDSERWRGPPRDARERRMQLRVFLT